jgi:Glycosyltransferase WbsX
MNKVRPIALHLPQFHPIPENDEWWGKGFTEWTNVTKAQPLFEGHYQPHLPADLGFYDLRLAEAREAQAALAREYGIYGFCYYHYWFNGRRILERPVDEILKSGRPDFPFMLCWANENWTRKWDGHDKEILLKQEYSAADDLNHIRHLIPYFKDPRYIRVDGKVVFSIYRSSLLPDIENTIKIWRSECAKEGIDLYLCRFESFGDSGKAFISKGFDAGIEFQPFSSAFYRFVEEQQTLRFKKVGYRLQYRFFRLLGLEQRMFKVKRLNRERIDYSAFVDYCMNNHTNDLDYICFPCATPSWDNTARNPVNPFILKSASPAKFKQWLSHIVGRFKPKTPEENFIFINAWNEWAEGNHLEPCRKWGRGYLEALKQAVEGCDAEN